MLTRTVCHSTLICNSHPRFTTIDVPKKFNIRSTRVKIACIDLGIQTTRFSTVQRGRNSDDINMLSRALAVRIRTGTQSFVRLASVKLCLIIATDTTRWENALLAHMVNEISDQPRVSFFFSFLKLACILRYMCIDEQRRPRSEYSLVYADLGLCFSRKAHGHFAMLRSVFWLNSTPSNNRRITAQCEQRIYILLTESSDTVECLNRDRVWDNFTFNRALHKRVFR